MHWMPILAEAYILDKVKEAQQERLKRKQQKREAKNNDENTEPALDKS